MLPNATPEVSPAATRAERRTRILAQLRAATTPLLEQLADTLVDAPANELCRSVEVRSRDAGHQLAAAAQQAGLDDQKKGGT